MLMAFGWMIIQDDDDPNLFLPFSLSNNVSSLYYKSHTYYEHNIGYLVWCVWPFSGTEIQNEEKY